MLLRSPTMVLVLVVAIATPPAAFAETPAECLIRKAIEIAAARGQIAAAQSEVTSKAVKVAVATYKALKAKKAWEDCPIWRPIRKRRLRRCAEAAKAALDAAIAELKEAWEDLKEAWKALAEALGINCDCL